MGEPSAVDAAIEILNRLGGLNKKAVAARLAAERDALKEERDHAVLMREDSERCLASTAKSQHSERLSLIKGRDTATDERDAALALVRELAELVVGRCRCGGSGVLKNSELQFGVRTTWNSPCATPECEAARSALARVRSLPGGEVGS